MTNIIFEPVEDNDANDNKLNVFIELWVKYMNELGDKRDKDRVIAHGKKIIEIQKTKKLDNKVYNIDLFKQNGNIVGFCFYSICEIDLQKDT